MDKRELSVYSQAGWIELSDAFPPSSPADAGKVLAVGEDGKPEWAEGSGGLPSTGSASAGDVLSLDEDKEPVWSAPSGGGGVSAPSVYCSFGVKQGSPETYYIYFTDLGQVDSVTIADLYENAIESDGAKYIYVKNNFDQPGFIGIEKEGDTYILYGWFTGCTRSGSNLEFAIYNIADAECSGTDTEVNLETSYVFVTTLTSPR